MNNTNKQKTLFGYTFYFTYELSWILIPLSIYLYYKYSYAKPIIFNTMICISLIGILNTVRVKKLLNSYLYYLSLLFHLILLFILKDFMKYGYLNKFSVILMLLSILIIYYLPWWPYPKTNKKEIIKQIVFINIILYSIYYLIIDKKLNIQKIKYSKN